jgi:hypothetical protein
MLNHSHADTIYPVNNGFEINNLGSGSGAYEYGTVPGWTLSGNPGEAANGSAFGVSGAGLTNHDGTASTAGQAALLQGGDGTIGGVSISQSISGFYTGPATVTFSAENRGCCSGGASTVNVYMDGTLIDSVTPPTNSFQTYTITGLTETRGSHTLSFAGSITGGDQTAFIDTVSLTSVPEPASVVLFGLGAVGLLVARRRKRLG